MVTKQVKKMTKVIVSFLFLIATIFMSPDVSTLNAAPAVGDLAPSFKLQDQTGEWVSIEDFKGKWLVVYFYPKDNTPGCTIEAGKFRDNKEEFNNRNASVVGISLDDVESHLDFSKTLELNFSILADEEKKASKSYEVLTDLGLIAYSQRQTFIIDPQGKIAKHYEDVDPDVHSAEVLAELERLMRLR